MVWIIIIRVPLISSVRMGSYSIFYFVYYRNDAAFPCKIIMVGLNGFIKISLSIIENTSYFIKDKALKQSNDPS